MNSRTGPRGRRGWGRRPADTLNESRNHQILAYGNSAWRAWLLASFLSLVPVGGRGALTDPPEKPPPEAHARSKTCPALLATYRPLAIDAGPVVPVFDRGSGAAWNVNAYYALYAEFLRHVQGGASTADWRHPYFTEVLEVSALQISRLLQSLPDKVALLTTGLRTPLQAQAGLLNSGESVLRQQTRDAAIQSLSEIFPHARQRIRDQPEKFFFEEKFRYRQQLRDIEHTIGRIEENAEAVRGLCDRLLIFLQALHSHLKTSRQAASFREAFLTAYHFAALFAVSESGFGFPQAARHYAEVLPLLFQTHPYSPRAALARWSAHDFTEWPKALRLLADEAFNAGPILNTLVATADTRGFLVLPLAKDVTPTETVNLAALPFKPLRLSAPWDLSQGSVFCFPGESFALDLFEALDRVRSFDLGIRRSARAVARKINGSLFTLHVLLGPTADALSLPRRLEMRRQRLRPLIAAIIYHLGTIHPDKAFDTWNSPTELVRYLFESAFYQSIDQGLKTHFLPDLAFELNHFPDLFLRFGLKPEKEVSDVRLAAAADIMVSILSRDPRFRLKRLPTYMRQILSETPETAITAWYRHLKTRGRGAPSR